MNATTNTPIPEMYIPEAPPIPTLTMDPPTGPDKIMFIKTNNREEWLALRHNYIGGSDAAAIVGLNAYCSPYALWAEKTDRIPGFEGNLATEAGAFMEEFVAKKFAEVTGKKVRRCNRSIYNSKYPWALANIDREIVGEDAVLEIKTTDSMNMKKFRGGEYPANYYCQVMHYLAVTGKKKGYIAVLIGNKELKIFEVQRDEEEIAALMMAESAMMWCIKTDTPPEIDGEKATADALKTIYSDADDSTADLTGCMGDAISYLTYKEEIDRLQKKADECANRIKAAMGNASIGDLTGYKISWKPQTKKTFDTKRFVKDHPELDLSSYYKESTSRVFRFAQA